MLVKDFLDSHVSNWNINTIEGPKLYISCYHDAPKTLKLFEEMPTMNIHGALLRVGKHSYLVMDFQDEELYVHRLSKDK